MPYPFAVLYTSYCVFIPSAIYQTQYLQWHLQFSNRSTPNKNVFSLDSARGLLTATTTAEEVLSYYPRIYPSQSPTHPRLVFALPLSLSSFTRPTHTTPLRPHLPPTFPSDSPQTPAPTRTTGSFFARQDPLRASQAATPSSLSSLLFSLAGVGLVITKMASMLEADVLQPYRQLGFREITFSGMKFLGCGEESRNRNRSGFWWDTRKRIWTRGVVESYWRG